VYLQSNLIPKIENVGRLKKLEYLNLALNNITRIENLEGCESLQKLDLTVNFVGQLTSIESLRGNYYFKELYLTGNPCTEYQGYREYVIATLDHLQWLDGKEIEKSERILAKQDYENIRNKIISQETEYTKKREKEKQEATEAKTCAKETEILRENTQEKTEKEEEDDEKRFWEEKTDFTPESRIELHQHIEEKRKQKEKRDDERLGRTKQVKETRFFAADGHVLNINQGKWDFEFHDDEDNNRFVLDLPCFKYLDTSLIDVDVQPTYVRVTVKGKVFQLALNEEVNPDSSSAKRSQTTGHLIIEMPKMKQVVKPLRDLTTKSSNKPKHNSQNSLSSSEPEKENRICHERLEVEPTANSDMDFSKIVKDRKTVEDKTKKQDEMVNRITKSNEDNFIDDPDVPPLI